MRRGGWRAERAGAGLERGVLGLTLLCAAAMAAVGLGPLGDAERAGREARERLVAGAAEDVRGEWRRMSRDGGLDGLERGSIEWPEDLALPAPRPRGLELATEDPAGAADFGLLFAAARWRERRGERLEEARELLESALALTGLSPTQVGLGRLRALQLAARAGEAEAVRDAWERARDALRSDALADGFPALALAAFAAAPHLAPQERAELRELLEALWAAGELALPDGAATLVAPDGPRVELPFEWGALLERVRMLAPQRAIDPKLELWLLAARVEALARTAGGLPEPPAAPEDVRPHATPHGVLRVSRAPGGLLRAGFVDPGECAKQLERRLRAAALLPAGLALDFGADSSLGEALSEHIPLWGDALGFTLRHLDPALLAAAERGRARVLRAALLLVAALAAGSGALGFRALKRERRLRALKSTFVTGVSHELRTPLSSILLMAENLAAGRVTDEAARGRYYAQMRKEAQRLRRLVDDVLDVSRLERGRGPELRLEERELTPFARQLAEESCAQARERGGEITVELGELQARGVMDANALRRALWNLVDNALKHGGGNATLSLGARSGALAIELRDRGPGIPPPERERLFEPFERLDRSNAAPGTGLGLSIAREIARAHGGELEARDAGDGPGVRMVMTIPLSDSGFGASNGTERGGSR